MKKQSIFKLQSFLVYLVVIFLNAFTDLGHKIIVQNTIFKEFDGSFQIVLTSIVNALILLPFVITFSPAGYLADRFSKNLVMRYTALLAVFLTIIITICYFNGWFVLAFIMTFLLALQSALFSPAKYGYIKELVGDSNLTAANGATQAVTTISILLGIMFYTVLFEIFLGEFNSTKDILKQIAPLGFFLIFGSVLEFVLTFKLPDTKKYETNKVFKLNRYLKGFYLLKNIKTITRKKDIFNSIVVVSMFWGVSQVILAIFGEYAKSNIGITNTIYVQGVMALAGIGIVVGSVWISKLLKYYANVGFAFVGSIGITFIVFMLPNITNMLIIAILFLFFGVFSGFILVSINSYIQHKSPFLHLGVILAGNNFIQNIFMITFLCLTTIFALFGMDSIALFYIMGFVSLTMSFLMLKGFLEKSVWSLFEFLASYRYKLNFFGLENIPKDKGIMLIGNHVSWLDWLFIQTPFEKEINFLMDKDIYNKKIFNWILKKGHVIPISPKSFKEGFKIAKEKLNKKEIVAIFPEGSISYDCNLQPFQKGFEFVAQHTNDIVIVAFYIDGMQGSLFARCSGKKPLFRRSIDIYFSKPYSKNLTTKEAFDIVKKLKEIYAK